MELGILRALKGTKITADTLHKAIASAIEQKILKAGDKLPSTRDIALYLEVSRTTVVKAFDTLEARGHLTSSHGSGTWVSTLTTEETIKRHIEPENTLEPAVYFWKDR